MIGASLQGIVENRVQHPERGRLKQIMKNSDGTAGFSLDIGNPKRLVFAEAPIDLMSYYELHKDELQDVKLVAMDGLKKSVISRYVADMLTDGKYSQTMSAEQIRGALDALNQTTNLLQEHPDMITLAVDNDEAGQNFVKGLQEDGIPVVSDLPPRQANQEKMDWNDYLKQMKKESIQMVENQEKTGGILPKKNIDGVEQKSLESFSDTQKEAVGELKSYGAFIIDDDFLERHYGSVEHDKENAQQTSISYEDYKQETKNLEESVKQKIASGDLSINVDDDVYAYLVFNGLGHSHPMQTLTEKRLDTLYSTDILEQLKAVTDENVDAYKTKGTPEQDRLYQSLKTNQKDLGLAEVSTRLVGEMAISACNANLRLAGLSQKGYQASYLSLFSNAIRTVIEYPYMENVGTGDYIVNHVDYALYHHLDNLSGNVTLTQKDLKDIIETASYHTPKIIDVDNKKTPDRSQEPYSNAGDSHRNPDSLGDLSPGAASKPVVDEPQPDFPIIAHLKFTTKGERMSTIKPGYHVITNGELNRLNKFAPGLQATAQWYLRELSGSTISYLYQDGETLGKLSVQFTDENFAHLTGISPKGVEMKQVVYDFAQGIGAYGNIQVSHAIKDKSMVLPLLPDILSSQSFVFNDLSEVEKFNRIDLSQAIKTNDEDLLLAIRDVDGVGIPASVMRMKEKLSESLQGKENIVLAVYRQRDGQLDQLSINEEYVKDNGEEMRSIIENRQFEEVEMPETSQPDVTAKDFTHVLDAVYNNGAQIGKDNRANIPEELYPAWDKYYEYAERYDNNFDVIVKAARADNLFDENSDFYKDVWLRKIQEENQKVKDSDGDGLTDDEEIALGTNPYSPDTDGDGILDSVEKASGTDATNPSDTSDSRKEEMSKRDLTLSEMIKAKNTESLNQHLQEGIKDYFDSDNYKNFLEGMSHFNNYSVRNIQLIKAQFPEASMVASFNEWKKRNGHVNKGEKALYVQAPVTVIKKDADGNPVINSETGEKETIAYFKPVPVFDVSQVSPVEGKELNLPKMGGGIPEQITKDYYQNVYRSLRDISQKENGIPIRFRELEKSDGFYNPKTNEITIKKGMTYEQTLSTLIHGMAHSELHNKKSLTERFEGKLTCSSKEIQAESVAYVVSNHLGFDTSDDSFAYLASWSQEPDGLENLKAQLEIVQEEASSLMKRIDKHLEKYQNLTVSKDETLTANQKRELSKATNPFYQSLQKAKEESKQVTPANEEQTKKVNRPTKQ